MSRLDQASCPIRQQRDVEFPLLHPRIRTSEDVTAQGERFSICTNGPSPARNTAPSNAITEVARSPSGMVRLDVATWNATLAPQLASAYRWWAGLLRDYMLLQLRE